MVKGVSNGIWVLLSLVGLVQLGVVLELLRRARERNVSRLVSVIHGFDREGPFS
jgi:hypothetical protein